MSERTSGIEISLDNSGTLFPVKDSTDYQGALKIDGVTFDVRLSVKVSQSGLEYFGMTGTARGNEANVVSGAMFPKQSEQGSTGNAKPSLTGDMTINPGRIKMDVAAWDKLGQKAPNNPYLSLKISLPRVKATA